MKTITQYREDIRALDERSAALCVKKTVDTLERRERLNAALVVPEGETRKVAQTVTPGLQVGDDLRTRDRFASFGEQLSAVMNAAIPGRSTDPRLYNATGLGETIPSDGGFLVQGDFSSELLKQVWETGILSSRCRRMTISGSSNKLTINGVDESSRAAGSRGGGVRGYWIAEAAQKTASQPKFRKSELQLNKLVGLCYFTDAFGFLADDAIIHGPGAGQPLGVLNAGCLVSQAKEDGQAADTIVAENVVKMYSRLFARSRASAVWLINQQIEPQLLLLSVPVGLGGALVYMPPGGLSAAPYGSLLGRPVIPIEQCQALGDQGDIILADFQNGYILAEKGGIQSAMSIHVKFDYDESVFRFVMRIDGQPVRNTAMTPYKGGSTATQSHFVTLAERA